LWDIGYTAENALQHPPVAPPAVAAAGLAACPAPGVP